jgi:hypothetical protein
MKTALQVAFAGIAFVCMQYTAGQSTTAQNRKPTFTMSIELKEKAVKPGADVAIEVVIVNATNREISLVNLYRPYGFDVVYAATSSAAPLTLKMRGPRGKDGKLRIYPDRAWTEKIPLGGRVHDVVSITDFFDLSQPGEYTIRLRRKDVESEQIVDSNNVVLTVLP